MKEPLLYIVQTIDTEGPLYESLTATFERIEQLTGKRIEPSVENLKKIQNKEMNLGGKEDMAALAFNSRLLNYNKTWDKMDSFLDDITSNEFRCKYADSFGNGWKYSWFIVDHADYVNNPRHKDLGYNSIFTHYQEYYSEHHISEDDFQWHAHPMSFYHEANHSGSSYINSPHIFESLCRRIIDCHRFPIAFTAGFHTERPDSHWLLEQFIPYDFSNESMKPTEMDQQQSDLSDGRFGDWRRADDSWAPYHPSHDDYQLSGNCNRVIFRRLNVGTRVRLLTQDEVDKAFKRVVEGKPTILAFCDHDFRDFRPDIPEVYTMLQEAHKKYPSVKWKNAKASEAAKEVMEASREPISIEATLDNNQLVVKTSADTFGPQPFLAIKTKGGQYTMQNFDFQVPKREWSFTFDDESIHPDDIDLIGIATNSMNGTGALCVIDATGKIVAEHKW